MEILSLPENEPFITGTEESIDICANQIMKLADTSIFHCRSGNAHIEIDLQEYELTENTQLLFSCRQISIAPISAMILPSHILFFRDIFFKKITARLDPFLLSFPKRESLRCPS